MNSFSNNLEKNEIDFNYSSSLIHILYTPNKELNKKCIFKNNNDVIISFKDTVINKTIYVSSSGLKRNSVFTSEDLDKLLKKKQLDSFISYFTILEDKLFRFDLYPQKYKKNIDINFLKSQAVIQKINIRYIPLLKPLTRSKYINKHKLLDQKSTYNGSFDKKIIIKSGYRKICLLTTRGIATGSLEPFHYNLYKIMTGLLFIFKKKMKNKFNTILISPYILLKFFSKNFQNEKKNINIFLNILIYYHFSKFTFTSFFKKRDQLKITWRRSNKFILKFFLTLQRKLTKFVNLFFQLIINTNIFTFAKLSNLNNLFVYKNETFFDIRDKFLNFKNTVFKLEEKLEMVKYLSNIIPIYLINIFDFKFTDLENIEIYFLFKTYILKEYLKSKFTKLKLFVLKKLNAYITELFLVKSLPKFKTYPEDSKILIARRLYWSEIFKPPLTKGIINKVKITALFDKKVKKKFINDFIVRKSKYSTLLAQDIEDKFIKFYKFYMTLKKGIMSINKYSLIAIRKKIARFVKPKKIKRRKLLKCYYKIFKWQKKLTYRRWRNKYRKRRRISKIKKLFKRRIKYIFKSLKKSLKKYSKKKKKISNKFISRKRLRKNRIFSSKVFLIKKLKLKIKKEEYIIPKIRRTRAEPQKIS